MNTQIWNKKGGNNNSWQKRSNTDKVRCTYIEYIYVNTAHREERTQKSDTQCNPTHSYWKVNNSICSCWVFILDGKSFLLSAYGWQKLLVKCWVQVTVGEENYKTPYLVKTVALKGKKNFTNIKLAKLRETILHKSYSVVHETGKWRYYNINLEEIKSHDLA